MNPFQDKQKCAEYIEKYKQRLENSPITTNVEHKPITRDEYISKIPERVFIDFHDDEIKKWSHTIFAYVPFVSKEKISYWIDRCVLDFNKQSKLAPTHT